MFGKNIPPANAAVRQKTSGRLYILRNALASALEGAAPGSAGEFGTHVLFSRGPADQPAGVARLLPFGPVREFHHTLASHEASRSGALPRFNAIGQQKYWGWNSRSKPVVIQPIRLSQEVIVDVRAGLIPSAAAE